MVVIRGGSLKGVYKRSSRGSNFEGFDLVAAASVVDNGRHFSRNKFRPLGCTAMRPHRHAVFLDKP